MKIININPGLISIPPNGWGAVEKIIWDYHLELDKLNIQNDIRYLNDVKYDDSVVVHVHVANLAIMCHERSIPYIFSIHDHHAYLFGKDSHCFKQNLKAIEHSVFSLSPCKFLVDYFGSKKLRYFSHAVNTNTFVNKNYNVEGTKLLCVANNGYADNQSKDRKGFKIAIQAAMALDLPLTIAGPSNNKKFFDTLEPEFNNYSKLTKLFDLNEAELIELYNNHSIFLHFSELEAGHPNLTLLEAMSCGLPVVGTFEQKTYNGMIVTERDVNQATSAISKIMIDYKKYKQAALDAAIANSYSARVLELTGLYSEYREKIFGNQLIDSYNECKQVYIEPKNTIRISHEKNGTKVNIGGLNEIKYKVKFVDYSNNHITYECPITIGMWTMCPAKYKNDWGVEVYDITNGTEVLVEKHKFPANETASKSITPEKNKIKITFDDGAKVDIKGNEAKKYKVKFIDAYTNQVTYETTLNNNMWATTATKYYNKWVVEVYDITDGSETLVEKHSFDAKDKTVKIVLDSESFGDLIAWIGAIDEFQKKHQCKLDCVVFNKVLRPIFEKNYPNIKFLATDVYADPYYAKYKIGYFAAPNYVNHITKDPRLLGLCAIATTILGLTDVEFKPNFAVEPHKSKKKYVCIATQSTSQAKYWNNKKGWDEVVGYLNKSGYEVWCIDKFSSFGVKESMNYMPKGCIDKTGNLSFEERMSQLKGAEFFIGLSSGLSWLAWGVGVPVVLISGFTAKWNEFYTPHRVVNESVCNSCWNDVSCPFNKGDWFWCPRNKDFECSKQITSSMVIEHIKKLI